jgi:hypothetical protein
MNSSRDKLLGCFHCGTLNVTGVRSCVNCHAPFYYNCPHCHSWVDNSFSSCPTCAKKLNWPKEVYYTEDTCSPSPSTSSAAIILLLSTVLLSIVAINLIANNSNPVDAISHAGDTAITNNLQANELRTATQPQIQAYSPVTAPSSTAQTGSTATYSDADVNYDEGSSSYQTVEIIPLTQAPNTTTDTNSPKSCSYLDTLYPNWGHCSGGSCRSACQ